MNQNDFYRVKTIRVPVRVLLEFMRWHGKNGAGTVTFPELMELPEGFVVVASHLEPMSRCVVLTIYHPTFDVIPEASIPPEIEYAGCMWNVRVLATDEEIQARPIVVLEE